MNNVDQILRSTDQFEVRRGFDLLKNLPLLDAVAILETLSKEDDPNLRCQAVLGMFAISPALAEDWALNGLNDPHEAVRWHSCEVLRRMASRRASPLVAHMLGADPDELVRCHCAFCLRTIGDLSVIPMLLNAYEHDTATDHEGTPIQEIIEKSILFIKSKFLHEVP